MTGADEGKLSLPEIAGEMWAVYRRHWTFLVPAAIVVLLPQSVGDALLEGSHVEHLRTAADFATLGAALVTAAVSFFGQAVYAGLAAAAVIDWRAGRPLPPLPNLLRALPLGRLVVLDIVITLLTAIGFAALIIPGLIVLTYLAISPVILKIEHLGVLEALSRSVQLVRGRALQVFVTAIGAILLSEIAVELVAVPFDGLAVLTVVNLIAEGIFQPVEGLAIALVAIHLLELHGEAPAPDEMARSLVGEHE
ncbi:MAG TPA: YciC family protein [Solirubrobacterales bacterium]|nr:YciC family protein [Solirubrobacterales bacterium]